MKTEFLLAISLLTWTFSVRAEDRALRTAELPFGASIAEVSERFLGMPFKDSPLGEGKGSYDSDPLYRSDAFDCTTFIETVWAIHGGSARDWIPRLQKIRYREGKISFVNRLHFISHDWVPYHKARESLQDLTADLGLKAEISSTRIDRLAWYKKMHPREIKDFQAAYPQEKADIVSFPYLPFAAFRDDRAAQDLLKNELRKGALLVNLVRSNWQTARFIGTDIDISHQGFLVLKDDRIQLRHASAFHKKVVETDFLAYIRAHELHPTLKGFQLLRLKD